MADQSLVHVAPQDGPSTHVLVIGVGKYPHLVGGTGPLLPTHQGLSQLTSPPRSALELADWFVRDFRNPTRALASVRLLVSSAEAASFTHPQTGAVGPVASATIDNIETAFKEWQAATDSHPDNLAVLYFCGHGLASGALTALLAEDYGKDPLNALDGALDFFRNHLGMRSCKAKHQLYLIDVCRTNARAIQDGSDYAGRVFLQPRAVTEISLRPVLYSTLFGEQAYGRENSPSHFCEALLAGLKGAGGDNMRGDWRVHTTSLHRAIEVHMDRKISAGLASAQIPLADELATFDLHYLPAVPEVPVFVSCNPHEALPAARLRCFAAGAVVRERAPEKTVWELALPVGPYEVEALFDTGPYRAARGSDYVYPPEKHFLPLEVGP